MSGLLTKSTVHLTRTHHHPVRMVCPGYPSVSNSRTCSRNTPSRRRPADSRTGLGRWVGVSSSVTVAGLRTTVIAWSRLPWSLSAVRHAARCRVSRARRAAAYRSGSIRAAGPLTSDAAMAVVHIRRWRRMNSCRCEPHRLVDLNEPHRAVVVHRPLPSTGTGRETSGGSPTVGPSAKRARIDASHRQNAFRAVTR